MWPFLALINAGSHAVGNKNVVVEIVVALPSAMILNVDKKCDGIPATNSTVTLKLKLRD